eukprot:CAMPEP_0170912352 /NCGR_PEP_ID=MMETSP0735-20130129/4272_1 /TAXON_ID=186038 /ORGANISM="Fragilariopsis kerguelensis, Strain L26-C5" /LENGTH=97 /DNA_ID=CAMNT_0011309495 /DNA_START=151 /DNA_END=441 /DNA_ORIENTATION=-
MVRASRKHKQRRRMSSCGNVLSVPNQPMIKLVTTINFILKLVMGRTFVTDVEMVVPGTILKEILVVLKLNGLVLVEVVEVVVVVHPTIMTMAMAMAM